MAGKEEALNSQEELSGFIFMCNGMTKPECYRFRVFGLPIRRKEVVERIQPGTYLFLFDYDLKLLYGIYIATSGGMLRIEQSAFGGKFPAQVRFKIHQDCLPLPENCFKHAIQDNYQKDSNKFSPELNPRQVRSLLSLFHPLFVDRQMMPNSVPAQFMLYQPSKNQLHLPASSRHRSDYSELLPDPQHTHRNMLNHRPKCHSPLMSMGSTPGPLLQDPQHAHQIILSSQPVFYSSMVNMGGSYAQRLPVPSGTSDKIGTIQSYAQSLPYPQHTHVQPIFHFSLVNQGSCQPQSLANAQYVHQNILNLQPDFNPYMSNMGHVNPIVQSHTSSIANFHYHSDIIGVPYIPQEVSSSASHSYQGSEAMQGTIYRHQQIGMGNEYHGSSFQTEVNIPPQQEITVEHNLWPVSNHEGLLGLQEHV